MNLRRHSYSAAALALLATAACVDSPMSPTPVTGVLGAAAEAVINKPPLDPSLRGQAWVCKDGSGPATNFTFAVSVDGGAATNHTVALGTCVMVHSIPLSPAGQATVSVTEAPPPANWALGSITIESNNTRGQHLPVINPPNASGLIHDDFGVVFTFRNTFTPPPSLGGRMTGGGAQVYGNIKITRGFTIHCDLVKSNNLEINWGGNKWHIAKPLTKATCLDDPFYQEQPPVAPFNTFIGEGTGRLNGVDGSKIYFTFVDAGEPGKNDKAAIRIIAPDGVTVALDIPLSLLNHGNIQAHYDQPHKQKP